MKSRKNIPPCFYRVSIKGLCFKDGKVMLIKEPAAMSGQWDLPGGGLDWGEDIEAALKREIKEEMGLEVMNVSPKPMYVWTNYFLKKDWQFHSLVLVYVFKCADFEFKQSNECEEIGFFDFEELQALDIHGQSEKLKSYLKPTDIK